MVLQSFATTVALVVLKG